MAIKILILNFGSILFIIANVALIAFAKGREELLEECCMQDTERDGCESEGCDIVFPIFISIAVLPSLCSALNPFIYVILTPRSVRMKSGDPQKNSNNKTTPTQSRVIQSAEKEV